MSVRAIGPFLLTLVVLIGGSASDSSASDPRRVGSAGMTVELPAGWYMTRPADGNVVDPLTRIAVSSRPLRPRSAACQIARYAPDAQGVSLVVVEWKRSDGQRGGRPPRFTWRSLPLQPAPAFECHDGPGGSVHFKDQKRIIGAYLLLGKDAPRELAEEARRVLETLVVERRHTAGAESVPLTPATLRHCRKSLLLRAACPRLVPRVGAAYLRNLSPELLGRGAKNQLAVFSLAHGWEDPDRPERNRPPWMGHLIVAGGAVGKIAWYAFAPALGAASERADAARAAEDARARARALVRSRRPALPASVLSERWHGRKPPHLPLERERPRLRALAPCVGAAPRDGIDAGGDRRLPSDARPASAFVRPSRPLRAATGRAGASSARSARDRRVGGTRGSGRRAGGTGRIGSGRCEASPPTVSSSPST